MFHVSMGEEGGVFQMGGFIFKWWGAMGALALVREGG